MSIETVTPYTFPYIEPGNGQHSKGWVSEELEKQKAAYLHANRQIVQVDGRHRKLNQYKHLYGRDAA